MISDADQTRRPGRSQRMGGGPPLADRDRQDPGRSTRGYQGNDREHELRAPTSYRPWTRLSRSAGPAPGPTTDKVRPFGNISRNSSLSASPAVMVAIND